VASGPATTLVKSRTLIPSSGFMEGHAARNGGHPPAHAKLTPIPTAAVHDRGQFRAGVGSGE
jgi:hypothetical protein